MEDISKTDTTVKHLNALHATRKIALEYGSNEKLGHPLKAKNEVATDIYGIILFTLFSPVLIRLGFIQ